MTIITNWPCKIVWFQRSPIDILLRVFPTRRRSEVENILQRCKGDILHAIELLACSGGASPITSPSDLLHPVVTPSSPFHDDLKSAFSPLAFPGLAAIAAAANNPSQHRYGSMPSANRRFLAAPYSGTGYLSTIIRPPPDFSAYSSAMSLVSGSNGAPSPSAAQQAAADFYPMDSAKAAAASPASNAGSDKTSYSD
jgi:doublesex- and mab-3-related transcription factor 4/5